MFLRAEPLRFAGFHPIPVPKVGVISAVYGFTLSGITQEQHVEERLVVEEEVAWSFLWPPPRHGCVPPSQYLPVFILDIPWLCFYKMVPCPGPFSELQTGFHHLQSQDKNSVCAG